MAPKQESVSLPSKLRKTAQRKALLRKQRARVEKESRPSKKRKIVHNDSPEASIPQSHSNKDRFSALDNEILSSQQFLSKEIEPNVDQQDDFDQQDVVDVDAELKKMGQLEQDNSSSEDSDSSDASNDSSSEASEELSRKKTKDFGVDIDQDKYRMHISGKTHTEANEEEDDDEFDGNALLGSESDEDDDDEEDPFKKMIQASRQIDEEKELVEEEAEQELQDMTKQQSESTLLKDVQEYKDQQDPNAIEENALFAAEDVSQIYSRIAENLRVLSNFKQFKEEGYSRQEYLDLLKEDLCKYYGYLPDLIDKFASMFSASEMVELLEANEAPRPVVLRTNPLKSRRREVAEALIKRGVNLDPLDRWSNVGLKVVDTEVPVGATPEYLAGWYMIQGASSFLPVIALSPEPNEVVVDMASAPGGKTTYLSALMKNTGVIYANDPEKNRTKGLTANIHRLGVRNAIVCNYDGRDLPKVVHPKADRVLLDAPCTGTGIVARDPSVKTTRDLDDIRKMSKLQKELLLAAIDTAKDPRNSSKPVYIVYSTCSITPEENEEVVSYALRKRFVKVVETGLPKKLGNPGFKKVFNKRFDPSVTLTRRIYPHAHNMDGFYVCKLQKMEDGPRDPMEREIKKKKQQEMAMLKKQRKKENIEIQKKRETHNRKLLQSAIQRFGGNVEAAKQWMKERKNRMLEDPEYKNLKSFKKLKSLGR